MKLDMSAIAKGYTCDLIGDFLTAKGCENYMVEIGGEVVAKGINEKGKIWTIGISKPEENAFFAFQRLQAIVELPDTCDGNFRKLPEFLCGRREKICAHHRSENRLPCATQLVKFNCFGRKLYDCRCICHSFYGNWA